MPSDYLDEAAADDIPGDIHTTASLTPGTASTGDLERPGDRDWYRLEVEAGRIYVIELQGAATGSGTLPDPLLSLFDATGALLASNDDAATTDSRLAWLAAANSTLYVEAAAFGGDVGTFSLRARIADDVPGDAGTGAMLPIGGRVAGEIELADDRDWYRIEVQAGHTYLLDLQGSASGAGTSIDPFLRLLDSDGNELAANDDGGLELEAALAFTAEADAVLFVEASDLAALGGTFTLSAREIVDPPDDTGTGAVLSVGEAATGEVQFAGDGDWFRLEAEAGRTYRIDLEGRATGGGTLADPFLRIFGADGAPIREDDDGGEGPNARSGFTAATAGTYFIAASSVSDDTGSYRLSAALLAGEIADNTATEGTLRLGRHHSGRIDFNGDEDWYRLEVQAGRTYVVDVEGSSTLRGTLVDPVLRVLNADGNPIIENDDGGVGFNGQAGFMAAEDGHVFIAAGGLAGEDSYAVRARELHGDIAGDLTTGADLALGSGMQGRIDFAFDADAYRVELEAGRTYVFELTGGGGRSLHDPTLELVDGGGGPPLADDDSGVGLDGRLVVTATADGPAWLVARGFGEDDQGSYRISAREYGGELLSDLDLHEARPIGEGSIQTNGLLGNGVDELFVTFLGGEAALRSSLGYAGVTPSGQIEPRLLFGSAREVEPGTSFSLGVVEDSAPFGFFILPGGGARRDLAAADLVLRNPVTGDAATIFDEEAPEVAVLGDDGPTPVGLPARFSLDAFIDDLLNPLNPGGGVQATFGMLAHHGEPGHAVVAFEDLATRGRPGAYDFNDLVIAVGTTPLSGADLAEARDLLFG
jgi:hypothetical protein